MKKCVATVFTALLLLLTLAVPNNVYAEKTITDEQEFTSVAETFMDKLLTDGKLQFDSVPANSEDEFMVIADYLYVDKICKINPYELEVNIEPSEDFKACTIKLLHYYYDNDEEKAFSKDYKSVPIKYNYDKKVKEQADKFLKDFNLENKKFVVSDMELINYWKHISTADRNEEMPLNVLANYSGELKKSLKYSNFKLNIDSRAGSDEPFLTEEFGMGRLMFNGVSYGMAAYMGATASHAVYVPEDTANTPEALKAAAQERFDKYLGKGNTEITVEQNGISEYRNKITDEYDSNIENCRQRVEELNANKLELEAKLQTLNDSLVNVSSSEEEASIRENIAVTEEEIRSVEEEIGSAEEESTYTEGYKKEFNDSFNKGGTHYVLTQAMEQSGDVSFSVTVNGMKCHFVILKDSSKMLSPKFKTKDLITSVEINTESDDIPLDTVIEAKMLTSGAEYDRAVEHTDSANNMVFDLNLHSQTLNSYVKKADGDTFEVRIPVEGTALEEKKLAAYYVDENDKVSTYSVKMSDGYACFVTDHFSVYTLAEIGVAEQSGHKMGDDTGALVIILIAMAVIGLACGVWMTRKKEVTDR